MTEPSRVESQVTVPLLKALITGLAAAAVLVAAVLIVQVALAEGVSWLQISLVGVGSLAGGFAGAWLFLMWGLEQERRAPHVQPVTSSATAYTYDALVPAIPLAFSARDASEFVAASVWRVNGVWQDKDGGPSWRAMERKGWTRFRWEQGVGWLIEHGILRWKDQAEHRAGLEWDYGKLEQFVGA